MNARRASGEAPPGGGLPRWKKFLYSAVAVVACFALLEGLLVLAGVRPVLSQRDPFVGFAPLPLFVETVGEDGRTWMVTAQNKLAWFNRQQFPRHKAAGTLRVFCLGGSTTYGHPYDDAASFSAWLRELLPAVRGGATCEVINCGGISYASYRVAALMEELSQYEPDLFIVYSGHNEFLEERTYGDIRTASPARLRVAALLARTRTYALVDRLLHPPADQPRAELASEVDAVLDHSVGPSSYHRDDRLRSQVLKHYRFNLGRMITIARAAGAKLLLITPAANLKDCSPFKSEHGENVSPQERQQVAQHLQRAEERQRKGDLESALQECQAALELDSRFAETHFRLGRTLLALNRRVEAADAFRRAMHEDVCPVRAPSEIPEIVRSEGKLWNVPVVDFVSLLQNECLRSHAHTVPGNEYFLDHVHPTLESTQLLGVAIVRELAASGFIEATTDLSDEQIADAGRRIRSRLDPAANAVALRTLAKVLNWAGKHEQAGPLAVQALQVLPDDPESLVLAAAYLKSTGQVQQAIDHYRRALKHAPQYAEAHRLLGAALVEQRELNEALVHFEQLIRLTPQDAHAWHMHGAVLAELGQHAAAVESYQRAASLSPDEPHLQFNLGRSLVKLGRHQEAAACFRRAIQQNPQDQEARQALEALPTSS